MTADEVRKAYRAQPFQRFALRLADGREYVVKHPEYLAFSLNDRHLYVATPDGTHETLDLRLVTSIQIEDRTQPH